MNARYQITAMDNQTGEMLKAPLECEGFTIICYHGPVRESGIHDRMRCWCKGISQHELACAIYSEPHLRAAARKGLVKGWLHDLRRKLRRKKA